MNYWFDSDDPFDLDIQYGYDSDEEDYSEVVKQYQAIVNRAFEEMNLRSLRPSTRLEIYPEILTTDPIYLESHWVNSSKPSEIDIDLNQTQLMPNNMDYDDSSSGEIEDEMPPLEPQAIDPNNLPLGFMRSMEIFAQLLRESNFFG